MSAQSGLVLRTQFRCISCIILFSDHQSKFGMNKRQTTATDKTDNCGVGLKMDIIQTFQTRSNVVIGQSKGCGATQVERWLLLQSSLGAVECDPCITLYHFQFQLQYEHRRESHGKMKQQR